MEESKKGMKTKDVRALHELFKNYHPVLFGNNLQSLIKAVEENKEMIAFDAEAFEHDRQLHPVSAITSQGLPRWDGSDAQRIMEAKLKQESFAQFLDGGKYLDEETGEIKRHSMNQLLRRAVYEEDIEASSVFGYPRWSKFLTAALAPSQSKIYFKKKAAIGKLIELDKDDNDDDA